MTSQAWVCSHLRICVEVSSDQYRAVPLFLAGMVMPLKVESQKRDEYLLGYIFIMSFEREKSPSFRSRQMLVKVSHASKRLPEDFFLPQPISISPKKRQSEPLPQPQENWHQTQRSEANNQISRIRSKNTSRAMLQSRNEDTPSYSSKEREAYIYHIFQTLQKKQNIIFQAVRQLKEEARPKVIQKLQTSHRTRHNTRERVTKSESKHRRKETSSMEKQKPLIARQARFSMKQLHPRSGSEGHYGSDMNVGFDGLLTFNRLR